MGIIKAALKGFVVFYLGILLISGLAYLADLLMPNASTNTLIFGTIAIIAVGFVLIRVLFQKMFKTEVGVKDIALGYVIFTTLFVISILWIFW